MRKAIKTLGVLSLVLLLSISLASLPLKSQADDSGDNKDNKSQDVSNESQDYHINSTSSDNNSDQADQETEDISEEANVNQDLKDLGDIQKEVKPEKVVARELKTYGDVIDRLNGFKDELAKVKNNAAVSDLADPKLTPAEKALLDKLLSKHQNNFTALNTRITELEGQINDLITLLTPIADQPINLQVKSLIYNTLSDFRSEINDLANLESLNIETLSQETL